VRLTLGEGTRFGMHLNDANTVVRLDATGLAAAEGTLRPGDQVVSVNGASTEGGRLVRDLLRSDGTIRPDGSLRQDGYTVTLFARRPAATPSPTGALLPPTHGLAVPPAPPESAALSHGGGASGPGGRGGAVHAATDWLRSRFAAEGPRDAEKGLGGGAGGGLPLGAAGAAEGRPRCFPVPPPTMPPPPSFPPPRVFPGPSCPREHPGGTTGHGRTVAARGGAGAGEGVGMGVGGGSGGARQGAEGREGERTEKEGREWALRVGERREGERREGERSERRVVERKEGERSRSERPSREPRESGESGGYDFVDAAEAGEGVGSPPVFEPLGYPSACASPRAAGSPPVFPAEGDGCSPPVFISLAGGGWVAGKSVAGNAAGGGGARAVLGGTGGEDGLGAWPAEALPSAAGSGREATISRRDPAEVKREIEQRVRRANGIPGGEAGWRRSIGYRGEAWRRPMIP
jgi:hypothetical protein